MTRDDAYTLANTLEADRPDAADAIRQLADMIGERDARIESLLADGAAARAEADALRHPPVNAAAVSLNEFKRRAAMLWVRVAGAAPDVQAKWDRISTQLIPSFTEIDLDDPTVAAILGMAQQDGLLTADEVTRILSH